MESLKGRLLVAGPSLWGTNLRRTVVLVAHHDEAGAIGVILNRPSGDTVAEAVPDLTWMVRFEDPVFLGGPVRPDAVVILGEFTCPEDAGLLAFGSVGFLVGHFRADDAQSLQRVRLFAGFAMWGPGELEAQVHGASAWSTEPATAEDVFHSEPEVLWDRVVERMGGELAFLRATPSDFVLN
ncbi:MAG: YqgE/AlgH family protein [Actinomycetota bacterium]